MSMDSRRIKQKLIDLIEWGHLLRVNRKFYVDYYLHDRQRIYSKIKENDITAVHPIRQSEWKINHKICYFSGIYTHNGERIKCFIKVMGPSTLDCYFNEQIVNDYIDNNSPALSKLKPRLIFAVNIDDYYILCYEHIEMRPVEASEELKTSIQSVMHEYTKRGILHTDFGLVNMAKMNGGGLLLF